MRRADPLILGAGPAGTMAAIMLATAGQGATLIDRSPIAGDPLCGGFLSWRTAEKLDAAGVDITALRAHLVNFLALYTSGGEATLALPEPAFGLSRHVFDNALRAKARSVGIALTVDRIRSISGQIVLGDRTQYESGTVFLATGKHDIQGMARPRHAADPALGLRLRLNAPRALMTLIGDRIELHLFDGGYAGIVAQESNSVNICLAVRKSLLTACGGDLRKLLERLAESNPALAARLAFADPETKLESIGAVPYGWIAQHTAPGIFRLGDQAAVIPSLAGEGIGLALASGALAAQHWLNGGPDCAATYQREFAVRARRPVLAAQGLSAVTEHRLGSVIGLTMAQRWPALVALAMQRTRVA